MRNLKRVLSLALAVMMLIGMMVVGANAAGYNDFTDKDEIVNKDAVSMLTTLGIINGMEDGSYFAPTEGVDRAMMAKMISVIMNQGVDKGNLYENTPTGLTDVNNSWAKGHINFCYTTGIIAGRGDGTFDPDAGVTGTEAAKMLLVAAGYDPAVEGLTGAQWEIKTIALASKLGIFRNYTKPVTNALSRDDAALLIYNALDVEMIQKYEDGYAVAHDDHRTILSAMYGVYKVEGVVTANEWAQLQETDSDAALREGRTTLENVIVYSSTTSNTTTGEGVREANPVTFNVSTPVDMLGKTVTLYIEKTTILSNSTVLGVATKDDVNVINGTAEGEGRIANFLKGTGVTVDRDTEYYVNYGYCSDDDAAYDIINNWDFNANGTDFNVNGVEVEVIDNNDDGVAEYVLYTQETLSQVSRYNDRDEVLTFHQPVLNNDRIISQAAPVSVSLDFDDVVFEDEGIVANDLILYVSYGGRTYVKLADIVTGTMTRVDRDQDDELYITLDNGDTYYESFIRDVASDVDVDVENFAAANARNVPGFDDLYDFILDSNGYVVAVRPAEEVVTNYALVLNSAWTQNALARSGQVEILMADGTTATYDLDWNESRKALSGIWMSNTLGVNNNTNANLDSKMELYLGTRDVQHNGQYQTGMATGSLISYSIDEETEELTIEYIYQGNTFAGNQNLEIANVNNTSTAGVGDNGEIVHMGKQDLFTNQYQTVDGTYENGRGWITVNGVNETWIGRDTAVGYDNNNNQVAAVNRSDMPKRYAVDLNTVAFYFYDTNDNGVADSGEYGVATGWNEMDTLTDNANVQVYPALEKTANGTYVATNLADVILFADIPQTISDDYMLVLNANAYADGDLFLNVVFEDGTVEEIEIDEIRAAGVDFEDPADFMVAYPYAENKDGTYDITGNGIGAQYADLYRTGTVAYAADEDDVDSNAAQYITYSDKSNIWDVTGVDSAKDAVLEGSFNYNVTVFAVMVPDGNSIRTAWIWDIPQAPTPGPNPVANLITRTWVDTRISATPDTYNSIAGAVQGRAKLTMSEAQATNATIELALTAAVNDGRYVILNSIDNLDEIDAADLEAGLGFAEAPVDWNPGNGSETLIQGTNVENGNIIIVRLRTAAGNFYAAYEIVVG